MIVLERHYGRGRRRVVRAEPLQGGSGNVYVEDIGPRGGVVNLYSAWDVASPQGRKRVEEYIREEREVLDAIQRAVEEMP